MERTLGCLCHFDLFCTLPVIVTTVNIQQVWIYSSIFFIIKNTGLSRVSPSVDASTVASLASDRHSRDPSPTPHTPLLHFTHAPSAHVTAVYRCTQRRCRPSWSTPTQSAHSLRCTGSPITSKLAGGLLGSFSTLLSCILNHTTPPRPPSLHKRNNRSLKRRRGGGGEESLFQDDGVFPLLFLRREDDACIERRERSALYTC